MQHAAVRMGQRPAARLAAACRAHGPKASHMARGGDAHGPAAAARKGRRQRGAARSGGT